MKHRVLGAGRRPPLVHIFAGSAILFSIPQLALAQDYSVLTEHNDNLRSGVQTQEVTINPSVLQNIPDFVADSGTIIQGQIAAQPLVVKGVPFASGAQDVVYVVDSTNTVYSFSMTNLPSGGNPQLLSVPGLNSQRALVGPGETAVQPGILSTPAIDPATHRMYVVARIADPNPAPPPYNTRTDNSKYVLHVLDLTTMNDVFPPVVIRRTVLVTPFTAAVFTPITQLQRTALLFNSVSGHNYVYFGFGSIPGQEDIARQHGWAFTYDVTSAPRPAGIYLSTREADTQQNTVGPGGIWQSGAGFCADAGGSVFLATGNGAFDANHDTVSVVRLSPTGQKISSVAPTNQAFLNTNDMDLGGGGPIVLPHNTGSGRTFIIGKDGHAYVVRSYTPLDIVQDFQAVPNPTGLGELFWGSPVYYNGRVYWVGTGDYVKSLPWNATTGMFDTTTPTLISSQPEPLISNQPGPDRSCGHRSLVMSANNNSAAVLWVIRQIDETWPGKAGCGNGALLAYDPTATGAAPLWSWRDTPGNQRARFPFLTIANGVLLLPTSPAVGLSKLVAITFFSGS